MASPACCAAGPPIVVDYTPKGEKKMLDGLEVYFVGTGPKAVIYIYDIFGYGPTLTQFFQICDKIADAGYTVALPKIFEDGKAWKTSDMPPPDPAAFMAWVGEYSFDGVIKPMLDKIMAYMKTNMGAQAFGIAGSCWGGGMAMNACTAGDFQAGAFFHPAFISPELAEKVTVPLGLFPAGEDPSVEPIKAVLDKKPFGSKCVYKVFDDMVHGWVGARGDYSDPNIAKRASEALGMLIALFDENIKV